jgi:hypothetical protein
MMGPGDDRRNRVFCIGLNKTGTVSLHEALTTLGYTSLHWGGPETHRAVMRAVRGGQPLLTHLPDEYDAFSDIGSLSAHFDLADAQYPGSRFILSVRNLEAWLDSRRRHVEKNRVRRRHGQYDGNFLEIDIDGWRSEYVDHERRVRQHFADRPRDLLVVDITAGCDWEPLCRFLDHPVPDEPFPWENRYRPWNDAPKAAGEGVPR